MHGVTASPSLVVLYAFVVHLIFVYATFDVHFQSPLVAGVERADARLRAPARRLVIFVADGARADAVFDEARGAAHVRRRPTRERRRNRDRDTWRSWGGSTRTRARSRKDGARTRWSSITW